MKWGTASNAEQHGLAQIDVVCTRAHAHRVEGAVRAFSLLE